MFKYVNALVNRLLCDTYVIPQFTAVDWFDLAAAAMGQAGMSRDLQSEFRAFAELALPDLFEVDADESFILKVDGRPFRCDCACNIFRKLLVDPSRFVCNGCGARWRGEA